MNDGTSFVVNDNNYEHHVVNEFLEFKVMIQTNELGKCCQMLERSLIVCKIQTIARKKAGILFQADLDME